MHFLSDFPISQENPIDRRKIQERATFAIENPIKREVERALMRGERVGRKEIAAYRDRKRNLRGGTFRTTEITQTDRTRPWEDRLSRDSKKLAKYEGDKSRSVPLIKRSTSSFAAAVV